MHDIIFWLKLPFFFSQNDKELERLRELLKEGVDQGDETATLRQQVRAVMSVVRISQDIHIQLECSYTVSANNM